MTMVLFRVSLSAAFSVLMASPLGAQSLALMLALSFLTDPAQRETYHARAVTVMACTFPEALAFANATHSIGDDAEAQRWLTIAITLLVT